jgi:hypothetical protein
MLPETDRRFLPIADRADMRVILAAELGRFGADKKVIDSIDGIVREGAADVLVSDDNDELIMLRILWVRTKFWRSPPRPSRRSRPWVRRLRKQNT